MKYYIVAGEASGDIYGAGLMSALKERDPEASFRFCGGDKMEHLAGEPLIHCKDLAFMGFKEVIMNLRIIWRYLQLCKKDIKSFDPDVVVLIDYPGFNLKIAEYAHKAGYKVVYYISPQVWAWKASRVKKIRKYVDEMIVILPFEKEFYASYDYPVHFAGHPLLDVIRETEKDSSFRDRHGLDDKPLLAILPGSRKQEISRMLPVMLNTSVYFQQYQYAVAAAPGIDRSFYEQYMQGYPNVRLIWDDTYQLMMHARAGLITSGTATLEAALFELPQVVCYKGSALSFWLGRMLVNVEYIALVNLILKKKAVAELIQDAFNTNNLHSHISNLLENEDYRREIQEDYETLREKLGKTGAAENAASVVLRTAKG